MTIPYFNIKTTRAIFLDDQKLFLDSLEMLLGDDIKMKTTIDQDVFLSEVDHILDLKSVLFKPLEVDNDCEKAIAVDLTDLCSRVFAFAETKPFSVAFIDYHMPRANGLEVCAHIKNSALKKVLFTGELDANGGIEALNAGIVQGYIKKSQDNLEDTVDSLFNKLNADYLKDINACMGDVFAQDQDILSVYDDPVFKSVYSDLYNQNDVVSACIYDQYGSQIIRFETYDLLLNVYPVREIKEVILPIIDGEAAQDYADKIEGGYILDYKKFGSLDIPPIMEWNHYMTNKIKVLENGTHIVTISTLSDHLF
tara:strand:- start:19 stop:948 length:930 start_codon:yes stop_codon:yes gene_type:complete